jgi:hypothetical protein
VCQCLVVAETANPSSNLPLHTCSTSVNTPEYPSIAAVQNAHNAHALGFSTAALASLTTLNYSPPTPNVTARTLNIQTHRRLGHGLQALNECKNETVHVAPGHDSKDWWTLDGFSAAYAHPPVNDLCVDTCLNSFTRRTVYRIIISFLHMQRRSLRKTML